MSMLSKAVDDYLSLRRKLGYKLYEPGLLLKQFVAFLEGEGASHITTELALRWATRPTGVQPAHWAKRLRAVRLFARHHSPSDPRTEVPPLGLLSGRPRRRQPYIYSSQEIKQLINATKNLPSRSGLRPSTYSTLLGLLSVTGMRISEALGLDRVDVDLQEGVLTIRRTKFGKTRLVPVHETTREAMEAYLGRRDRIFPTVTTSGFFLSDRGTRLGSSCVRRTFYYLSRQVGLRGVYDHRGPTLHDIRHAFAVETVLRWYRAGLDVDPLMPVLSTYLGHGHTRDTYWYISSVPELLRLAASRLDRPTGDLS